MKRKITKKQIIVIVVLSLIGIAFATLFKVLEIQGTVAFDSSLIPALMGFIFLFIGWFWPNHYEYSYYRSHHTYDRKSLPDDVKQQIFATRFPLMLSGLILLIVSFVIYFI